MKNLKIKLILATFLTFFLIIPAKATCNICDNGLRTWSIMGYGGPLSETNLLDLTNFKKGQDSIYAIEIAKELDPDNIVRRFFQPIATTISFANVFGYIRDPEGPIYEWDPNLLVRWANFPWDKYIVNTYAIGWGISYDTRVSAWEKHDSNNTKRLLNFLAFETTLALPCYPQTQLVFRLHHRSGVFGLYGADNAGSNYFTVGLRYFF